MSEIEIQVNAIGVTGDQIEKLSKDKFTKNVTLKVGNDRINYLSKNKTVKEETKEKRNDQYDDDIIK